MRTNRRTGECPQCGGRLLIQEWSEFHPYGSDVVEECHYDVSCTEDYCCFEQSGTGVW